MKIFHLSFLTFIILLINLSICFPNNNRLLSECHPNCEECLGPPLDFQYMNCLSCKDGFHYYKSKNCLNCPKYINYELTRCIELIPDGYYLENETFGTLGKCHELCKTCNGPPTKYGMQCIECKYKNNNFSPIYKTDCPDNKDNEKEYSLLSGGQCPRNEPILVRKDFCAMIYCSEKEYKNGTCEVSNDIIEIQWINKMERFGEGEIKNICIDYGDNGELFLFGQEKDKSDNKWLYIYGIDKNQKPMFIENDQGNLYYSYYKKINIPYNITLENLKIVKNYENDKLLLMSNQIEKSIYIIDYIDKKTIEHKFNINAFSYKMGDIIYINYLKDIYFINLVTCQNSNDCYGFLRKIKIVDNDNTINLIKEHTLSTKIKPERNFICMESFHGYIQCFYSALESNQYILELLDVNNLEEEGKFIIEEDLDDKLHFIKSMLKLNNEAFIIAYSMKNNLIKVLIKYLYYNETNLTFDLFDYIQEVPQIYLNENNTYILENPTQNRNSLCKINENKFAILLNAFNDLQNNKFQNEQILIYIFTIFNEHKNINVRKYSINFKLYNMFNYGKILGYTFGKFFGILVELNSPENRNIINANFITFGYINTINNSYEIYNDDFFPENSRTSYPIKLSDFIENKMNNNLFGYTFDGVILLSLIDEKVGYFLVGFNYKVLENQVINVNSDIKLELKRNYTPGNYSIEFAGVAEEPRYDDIDKYSEEVWSYPKDTTISEKKFYKQDILIGKRIVYKFKIKENQLPKECYPSCLTCDDYSEDSNNQMCTSCKEQFYFINGTQNCYYYAKDHYYFDEITKKYYPCYKDCLTCDKKEISSKNMNCLSCSKEFIFYNKSKNCLKCPNFVNYNQTQCVSSIPEGYYISNKVLGIIEPCYSLCKSCSKGPTNDTTFHMNCDVCLYENKNFIPFETGDCPQSQDVDKEVNPVDGQCPRNLPILKNNKCKIVYCTKKELEDRTCVINNDFVKKQWLNKINFFPNEASYIKYDKGENGEIVLLAQKKEGNNIDIYLYGFDMNNNGLFYEKNNNSYTSYKKLSLKKEDKFIEKIKYIEIDNNGYLINIIKDDKLNLIDFYSKEFYTHSLTNTPSSIDKFEKYINTNNKYFYDYIYCNNIKDSLYDACFIGITNYQINAKNVFKKELNIEEIIRVKPKTKLICINNIFSSNYILCKYNSFQLLDEETFINIHILALFDSDTLTIKNKFVLDNYFMPNKQVIDGMISMNGNNSNFIIAYSTSQNIITILFKTIKNNYKDLDDIIYDVPYIKINEDLKYNLDGDVFSNDLCKIDNDYYILLIKTKKKKKISEEINTGLLIISLRIYNFTKVILRYYHYDFTLYNMNLEGNLIGYNLNGFFGALFEFNSKEKEKRNAAFITFGFVNSTNDVSIKEGTLNLIDYKKNIKISDYILGIDNNLFGYELEGVKIINIPDVYKVGGFLDLKNNYNLIKMNDIISISSELRFRPVNNPTTGNYSISFAGIVKEPSEQISNNFSEKTEYYPKNANRYQYIQKTFMGKIFNYNFALNKVETKCFQNCEECLYVSDDINYQSCLKCKPGFYFVYQTQNCFDKLEHNYYFNSTTKIFYPCYKDCYTCNAKEKNSTYMNCLSCLEPLKFYEKNKNCLKCDKYTNFEQTQCIDSIPTGYYLLDKEKGIIDKCYHLCKTCSRKEFELEGKLNMNCDSCKFKNNSKIQIEGNCPEYETLEEKDEGRNNFVIIFSIILSILILIAILIVLYFKCYKSNKFKKDPSNYINIDGKNIPFDDEDGDIGIN